VLGIRERSPALTEAGLVMNDGYSGPVLYVSYPPFPPRAKDILERRVLICATRVRGLHYPVWAAVVPPLKNDTVFRFRRPSWGNLAALGTKERARHPQRERERDAWPFGLRYAIVRRFRSSSSRLLICITDLDHMEG
jgi:hypothetical protein